MATRKRKAATAPDGSWEERAQIQRIRDLVDDFSIELVPTSAPDVGNLKSDLAPGSRVYLVAIPDRPFSYIVETATELRRAGLQPVPHIAARSIADRDRLADYLWRLTSAGGVDQVLVIGGTRAKPVGDYQCSQDILDSGLLQEYGVRRVGLAGHPEGHPDVDDAALMTALRQKIETCRRIGIDPYLVSQFSFDPHAVVTWEAEIRRAIGPIPIHVGVPGPASLTSLVGYARKCRIGDSVRFLTKGASTALKLVTWTPDDFLTALASYRSANPGSLVTKMHFFSFGGAARTARWLTAVGRGGFTMRRDGRGFSVVEAAAGSR